MEQRHTNPGYSYMIEKALKSFRNQTGTERVSRQAIIKYVKENFDIGTNDKRISFAVSIGIKRGVDCGQIIRCSGRGASGSFKLAKKQKTGLMSSKVKKTKKTLVNINVSSSTHTLRDGKVTGSSLNSTKQLAIMNKTFSTYSASANAEQRYHSSKGSKESFTDKTPVPNGNPQPKQNINDNIHFLHEVSSCLNRLNDRQRAFAKMKMMHLLYNVEFKNLTDKSTDNSFNNTVKVEPDDDEQEEPAAEVRTADETNVTNDSVALVDEPLLDQQQNSTVKLKKKKSYQDVEELKVYHAMTPEEVSKKLDEGELHSVDQSNNPKYTAPAWKQFRRVYYKKKGLTFAFCPACRCVLRYNVWRNGMKKLYEHKCEETVRT